MISKDNTFIYLAQVLAFVSEIRKLSWDSYLTAVPSSSCKASHCGIEPDSKSPES